MPAPAETPSGEEVPTSPPVVGAPNTSPPTREPGEPDPQQEYIKVIRDAREQLYQGVAGARLYKYAEVNRPFPMDLRVCGSALATCSVVETYGPHPAGEQPPEMANAPQAHPAPRGAKTPLGPVHIGGRVRAELTTFESGIDITVSGPDVQVVADPTDVAEWRWTVLAKRAGRMTFQISVTTLKADTDEGLFPTRYFDVAIDVEETLGNTTTTWLGRVNQFTVGAGATLAAAAVAVVAYLTYRRQRAAPPPDAAPSSTPAITQPVPALRAKTPRQPGRGRGKQKR
ncbi:hypothetical protein OHA01_11390 [Micromonospora zamorensis]|uniref:hypothetical protein n=1 Tax=Micromonospora zamorensis TaxID=709883 RepID=UPI00386F725D|nr:hypothetical protein OHA01_11390 [Micromonospora zamorensis]